VPAVKELKVIEFEELVVDPAPVVAPPVPQVME
jgi:hypothetical protein